MHTDTSDHESKAKHAATPARSVSRRRHPAPDSSTTPPRAATHAASGNPAATGYTFRTWNRLHSRNRRIHFSIAIAVSVAAHVGLVLSGEGEKKVAATNTQTAKIVEAITFDMPEPEETPVEVEDSEQADTPPAEFAPPMQADLPSLVTVDSFVQPLQPPVPSGISTDMDMMAVPTTVAIGSGSAAPKLFELSELDRVPNRIRTGLLEYPAEFRRSRTEGRVVLAVIIDPTGRVTVEKVLESTHPEFSRAAMKAAEQCRYEPPIKRGVAVSARYTWPIAFALDSEP